MTSGRAFAKPRGSSGRLAPFAGGYHRGDDRARAPGRGQRAGLPVRGVRGRSGDALDERGPSAPLLCRTRPFPARGEGDRPRAAPMAQPETAGDTAAPHDEGADSGPDKDEPPRDPSTEEPPIWRNPPRDWAAPPPWAPGGTGAGSAGSTLRPASGDKAAAPGFRAGRADESQGLAGSAADRLTVGPPASREAGSAAPGPGSEPSAAPDEELAGLVVGRRVVQRPHLYPPPSRSARRPSVSSTRPSHRERDDAITGPSWERSRRYEAYPTIRARTGLPSPDVVGRLSDYDRRPGDRALQV